MSTYRSVCKDDMTSGTETSLKSEMSHPSFANLMMTCIDRVCHGLDTRQVARVTP